jgi:sugar O-acyltransferase (sialic acid O-acetyltransferase NeuD family)
MSTRTIGILGAGGQADEAVSFLDDTDVLFYAMDDEYRNPENASHINIAAPTDQQKEIPVVAAVGAADLRRSVVEKWPGANYTSVISRAAYVDPSSRIAEGCIISPYAVITTHTEIGSHSIVNIGATVSHDCRLGQYVTVSPGAHIAGTVTLGDGVFVGIGAIIKNGVKVAPGVVIGAGAVVLGDIETENSVVVGCPAKTIRINEGWLHAI